MLTDMLLIEGELGTKTGGPTYRNWLATLQGPAQRADSVQILVWYLRRVAGQQMDRLNVDVPFMKLTLEDIEDVSTDPEAQAASEAAT